MTFEEKAEIVISQLRADRDRLQESLSRCIEIPDGATNGDMIKAVFPLEVWLQMKAREFNKSWWNAPYEGGKE